MVKRLLEIACFIVILPEKIDLCNECIYFRGEVNLNTVSGIFRIIYRIMIRHIRQKAFLVAENRNMTCIFYFSKNYSFSIEGLFYTCLRMTTSDLYCVV